MEGGEGGEGGREGESEWGKKNIDQRQYLEYYYLLIACQHEVFAEPGTQSTHPTLTFLITCFPTLH